MMNSQGGDSYQDYSPVFSRIEEALKASSLFEALSLAESVIAERLWKFAESRGSSPFEGKNLSSLISSAVKLNTDQEFVALLNVLDQWRAARNTVVHSYAGALIDDSSRSPETAERQLEDSAKEGLVLARKVCAYQNEPPAQH